MRQRLPAQRGLNSRGVGRKIGLQTAISTARPTDKNNNGNVREFDPNFACRGGGQDEKEKEHSNRETSRQGWGADLAEDRHPENMTEESNPRSPAKLELSEEVCFIEASPPVKLKKGTAPRQGGV